MADEGELEEESSINCEALTATYVCCFILAQTMPHPANLANPFWMVHLEGFEPSACDFRDRLLYL